MITLEEKATKEQQLYKEIADLRRTIDTYSFAAAAEPIPRRQSIQAELEDPIPMDISRTEEEDSPGTDPWKAISPPSPQLRGELVTKSNQDANPQEGNQVNRCSLNTNPQEDNERVGRSLATIQQEANGGATNPEEPEQATIQQAANGGATSPEDPEQAIPIMDWTGSVFNAPQEAALAHCVSSDLHMGAGIAKQFITRWPDMRTTYATPQPPGTVFTVVTRDRTIFNLITKDEYRGKPTIQTLESALTAMRDEATRRKIGTIAIPEIGSGLDMLLPEEVIDSITRVFKTSKITILMYHLRAHGKKSQIRK